MGSGTSNSALVLLVLAVSRVGALDAQQPASPAAEGQSYIMGFMLVPWGSAATDIHRVYGKPLMEQGTDDRQVLIYKEGMVPIFSIFYLDKDAGLVKGVSTIPYAPGPDCERAMQQSIDRIVRIYPALKPVEEKKHEDASVPFCEAADNDKASWSVAWKDPVSGNSVRVVLEAGDRNVAITYLSATYRPDSTASN